MFQIPFINRDGGPQTYSSEFDKMYQLERGQNLMSPDSILPDDSPSGGPGGRQNATTLYDTTDGIYNQARLFENNDDPKEDQTTTPVQAMERIRNNASIDRPMTQSEQRFNLLTDDNFDIRFRNQLLMESVKAGDNIFSEFSQDHVNGVRESNTALNREENLYDIPAVQQSRAFQAIDSARGFSSDATRGGRSMLSQGLDTLFEAAKSEQRTQQEAQGYRDRALRRGGHGGMPTMTQNFEQAIKGKPPARTELFQRPMSAPAGTASWIPSWITGTASSSKNGGTDEL
jgi:hypothetical protein